MKQIAPLLALGLALSYAGCGGSSPSSPSSTTPATTTTTTSNLGSSHDAGLDCTTCHSFTVAGTAYKADGVSVYPGATIRLSTAPDASGTTLATLVSDATGNFLTSAAISFGPGLYITATGTSGNAEPMPVPLKSGACNSCHGPGNRILVN
jgi:hypothetical protein